VTENKGQNLHTTLKRVILSKSIAVVRNVDKAELQNILLCPLEIATKLPPGNTTTRQCFQRPSCSSC